MIQKIIPIIICLSLAVVSCATHNLRAYRATDKTEKSMTVPPGGQLLLGAIKDELVKNGWTLYVDRGPVIYQGTSTPSVNVTQKDTYKTRYRLEVRSSQWDVCFPGGGPAIAYDVSIIDNKDGAEVMNLSGNGCQDHAIEKFHEWLNLL